MDLEIFKGCVDVLILSLLENRKNSYGYEISKIIKKESNMEYSIGEGTLYTSLRRLEKKSLITSKWKLKEERNRKYYEITDEGKNYLSEKLDAIKKFNNLMENLLGGKNE